MDFYDRVGKVALGSRLRRLGDRLADEAIGIYALYGNEAHPRWFPVLVTLAEHDASVSEMANAIGHTHASVSQIVREMVDAGYATLAKRGTDGRKTFVTLSKKGKTAAARMADQCVDVELAVEALLRDAGLDLWRSVAACEAALEKQTLLARVHRVKLGREGIRIVPWEPRFARAFKRLNTAWIEAHFAMEEPDRRTLDDPEGTILAVGGDVVVALHGQAEVVGVCALVPHGARCFELAKMTVAQSARGKGVGLLLGHAAIERARALGATRLYLESNTKLAPAIRLYERLGFTRVRRSGSAYSRCNIQMERAIGDAH